VRRLDTDSKSRRASQRERHLMMVFNVPADFGAAGGRFIDAVSYPQGSMTTTIDRTRRPFKLAEAIAILQRTPAALDALLRGLPEPWIAADEGTDTWSPFDIVGHLIHGERADWIPRARRILEDGESRAFEPFDRFAQFAESQGRRLPDLLDEFAVVRQNSLNELAALNLKDSDLDRRGMHPALGAVTMRELLATWVAHDLDHVMQISRVLARQYTDEVGPWRAYLRIIREAV
jgi:hypothetical protein